jgi:hypothetical protein
MKTLLLLAACLVAVHSQELLITASEQEVVTTSGQQVESFSVVISNAPRAPFPAPRSMPEARMAVMRMMANCKPEAFKLCGAQIGKPVCPKKLAMCLSDSSHLPKLSPTCKMSIVPAATFMGMMQQQQQQKQEAAAPSAADPATPPPTTHQHGHMHHGFWGRVKCAGHHLVHFMHTRVFWTGFLCTFLPLILLLLVCKLFCSRDEEAEQEAERIADEEAQIALAIEMSAAEAAAASIGKSAPVDDKRVVHLGTPSMVVVVGTSSDQL